MGKSRRRDSEHREFVGQAMDAASAENQSEPPAGAGGFPREVAPAGAARQPARRVKPRLLAQGKYPEQSWLDELRLRLDKAQGLEQIVAIYRGVCGALEAMRRAPPSVAVDLQLRNRAAEVKLLAQRKMGTLLSAEHLRGGDRKSPGALKRLHLQDMGITRNESARWQREAAVPEALFQRYCREMAALRMEPTVQGLARWAGSLPSSVAVHGDCPNFRGGDDVALSKELHRRENGTVPFGRKGTGTFFGLGASTLGDDQVGRKMSQSPAACERLPSSACLPDEGSRSFSCRWKGFAHWRPRHGGSAASTRPRLGGSIAVEGSSAPAA